jgi:hypothetical protein
MIVILQQSTDSHGGLQKRRASEKEGFRKGGNQKNIKKIVEVMNLVKSLILHCVFVMEPLITVIFVEFRR